MTDYAPRLFTDDASIAALDAAQTPDDVLAVLGDVSA